MPARSDDPRRTPEGTRPAGAAGPSVDAGAETQVGAYPGQMAVYHPNRSGTGAAVRLQFRLNRRNGDRYNCFFLEMARQADRSGGDGGARLPARFDWRNRITVKLGFADVCRLLAVLEGKARDTGGNGLYHQTAKANTLIALRRSDDQEGFYLAVSRKSSRGEDSRRCHILLSEAEGIGFRCLFQSGLFFMTFHADLFSFFVDRASS